MVEKITVTMLKDKVLYLNELVPGKDYQLDTAYGGWTLYSKGYNVLKCGYTSKKKLCYLIDAYIVGVRDGRANPED
jgi:hypothetical protein